MRSPFQFDIPTLTGRLLIVGGSILALAGTVQPWGRFTALHSWHVALPGAVFGVGLAAAAMAGTALAQRKMAILCALLGIGILIATDRAKTDIPIAVRGQIVSLQAALIPVNRTLSQLHVDEIDAGNYGDQLDSFIGPGIATTRNGAWILLAGALLGLRSDGGIRALYLRFGKAKCRRCGEKWPAWRDADYCPACGFTTRGDKMCSVCHAPAAMTDAYCSRCGQPIADAGVAP